MCNFLICDSFTELNTKYRLQLQYMAHTQMSGCYFGLSFCNKVNSVTAVNGGRAELSSLREETSREKTACYSLWSGVRVLPRETHH